MDGVLWRRGDFGITNRSYDAVQWDHLKSKKSQILHSCLSFTQRPKLVYSICGLHAETEILKELETAKYAIFVNATSNSAHIEQLTLILCN